MKNNHSNFPFISRLTESLALKSGLPTKIVLDIVMHLELTPSSEFLALLNMQENMRVSKESITSMYIQQTAMQV